MDAGDKRQHGDPTKPQRPRLPRRFGWLIRLLPETACSRSQLSHFLSDPELAALLAAAPQLDLVLRRLCHMLGIRLPDHLASFLRNLSRPPSQEQTPESQSGGSNTARSAGEEIARSSLHSPSPFEGEGRGEGHGRRFPHSRASGLPPEPAPA